MRLVFLGTSDFSLKSLKALIASKHEVLAVVTKEDKIGNRNKVFEPPVKTLAAQNGILVYQFKSIRKQGVDVLKAINPDIIVTCSFGQILSQEILDIPKFGVINVHASLLPKYRGASPIQQSILNGDRFTGVTIMQTEYAIDSGDVLLAEQTEIGEKETAGELFSRLADLGAKALLTALSQIENGTATYTPQNHSEATFCGTLKKEDGLIDFSSTAERLDCFVRGLTPWPSAYTYIAGKKFKIFEIEKVSDKRSNPPCAVVSANCKSGLLVQASNGVVRLKRIQEEGKKQMSDSDYLLGHKIEAGIILGRF